MQTPNSQTIAQNQRDENSGKIAVGSAVCVATNPDAAQAGRLMLEIGGNAFDAVAAIGFMESVVTPNGTGLGGYGASGIAFHAARRQVIAIDANTVAPAAAKTNMFPVTPSRDPNAYSMPDTKHKLGPLSVGVPGVVAGLGLLVEKFGKLKIAQVIEPALHKARSGVLLTRGVANTWHQMKLVASGATPAQHNPPPGDQSQLVQMKGVAAALELISREGPRVFYEGQIGRDIASHIQKLGGILTAADMAAYQPLILKPNLLTLGNSRFHTPPPSAGGLTSLQMIALAHRLKLSSPNLAWGSANWWHAWLEIMKTSWNDRLTTLTDNSFMKPDSHSFLSPAHLDHLWAITERAIRQPDLGRVVAPDPLRGTIHCAAADSEGNHVAWTQTHGGGFGSQVMVPHWEVVLGHGMCRFEPRPGWPNSIAPGKRPLHNMCPIIVTEADKPIFSVGAQGGRTIVNNVATICVSRFIFGRNSNQALNDPRIQCETIEPFQAEKLIPDTTLAQLTQKGHQYVKLNKDPGSAQIIDSNSGNTWAAYAEPRLPRATGLALL